MAKNKQFIDQRDFAKLRKLFEREEYKREKHIQLSREIIKDSKVIINLIHNSKLDKAKEHIKIIKKKVNKLIKLEITNRDKIALQEYVEALAFYFFITEKRIIKFEETGIDYESYILGLCDLTGELMRKAVISVINNESLTYEIYIAIKEIYSQLVQFNFRNNELRKKFDSIKWNLTKVEDIIFSLNLRDKKVK